MNIFILQNISCNLDLMGPLYLFLFFLHVLAFSMMIESDVDDDHVENAQRRNNNNGEYT